MQAGHYPWFHRSGQSPLFFLELLDQLFPVRWILFGQCSGFDPGLTGLLFMSELALLGAGSVGSAGNSFLGLFVCLLWRAGSPVAFVCQAEGGKAVGAGVGDSRMVERR